MTSMRNLLAENVVKRVESNFYLVKNDNCVALDYYNKDWSDNFDAKLHLTSENVDNYKYLTGPRGLLLLEWVRLGNEVTLDYEQNTKPSHKNVFDKPLKQFFSDKELSLMDVVFFGKGNVFKDNYEFFVEKGSNFLLKFTKTLTTKFDRFDDVYDLFEDSKDLSPNPLKYFLYDLYDQLYQVVRLHTNLSEDKYSKKLMVYLMKNLDDLL